ncbi:MAG: GTPase [Gammaproteobacteria bacterium]|nr:GTPase [Gammaproteobacteria bacterium]MCP5135752.1 GTPase [Gammaproteobacteria bacterium]
MTDSALPLIFVYNADSGRLNAWLDIGHKLLSPRTYNCDLCHLTHGVFRERAAWKAWREHSKRPLQFLHRDEFEARYGATGYQYPIVLSARADGGFDVVLSAFEIAEFQDLDALIRHLP